MKKVCTWIVVALALGMLVGCSKGGGSNLVGKYKGEIKMPAAKKDDPAAKMAESFAKAFANNLSLELKADNTFKMNVMMELEGTWAQSGTVLTLTPKKMGGVDVAEAKKVAGSTSGGMDKPLLLEVGADGKTLTAKDEKGGSASGSLVFTKE